MRISDWSSDVCSSDLVFAAGQGAGADADRGITAGFGRLAHRRAAEAGCQRLRAHGRAVVADRVGHRAERRRLRAGRVRAHANGRRGEARSEEHTSELQSLMRISYAVFRLQKKNYNTKQ